MLKRWGLTDEAVTTSGINPPGLPRTASADHHRTTAGPALPRRPRALHPATVTDLLEGTYVSPTPASPLHLAVALEGTGWHPPPGGNRCPAPATCSPPATGPTGRRGRTRPARLRHPRGRTRPPDLPLPRTRRPHRPGTRPPRRRAHRGPHRPLTRHIGLVPTAVVTHTEPFHLSKAIATLDHVSTGRAGVRVQITARPDEAAHFGRRSIPRIDAYDAPAALETVTDLFDEAADYVEVLRAGCGTAGRTTPRSATSPPGASSTGTSSTTSTSKDATSASRAPPSRPARPRASPWSPPSPTTRSPTAWSPARPTSATSPRTTQARPAPSSPRSARNRRRPDAPRTPCTSSATSPCSSTTTRPGPPPAASAWTTSP